MKNLITIINLSIIIGITSIFTQSDKILDQANEKPSNQNPKSENVSGTSPENTVKSNFSGWTVNSSDKAVVDDAIVDFLKEMTEARLMDLEEGKTAEQRGTTKSLKQYGSLMVKDQSEMLKELKKLAALKNVSIPTGLGSDKAEALGDLREVHGSSFDKKFIKMMILDHKRDVKKFERAMQYSDADIQVFATKYFPVVQSHLERIKALKKSN